MSSSLVVGLDLGQVHDHTALAVVERVQAFPPGRLPGVLAFGSDQPASYVSRRWGRGEGVDQLHVRHLQRWELGTPYDVIVEDVSALMRTEALEWSWLLFDATGVGRGIKDMFMAAFQRGEMGHQWPMPKTITGEAQGSSRGSIAKRDLMSVIQVALQQDGLKIAEDLPLRQTLQDELKAFRLKISNAGRDTYEFQRREGLGHGDLTIAVALAAWSARHQPPRTVEDPLLPGVR